METSLVSALACINCRKSFAYNEALATNGRMPIVLPCGHAICVGCAGSFQTGHKCRECGNVAQRRLDLYKSGFPPHLGIIGGLIVATEDMHTNQKKPPLHGRQSGAPLETLKARQKTVALPEKRVDCDSCHFDLASVRCITCARYYCQKCLRLSHKPNMRPKHRVILLSSQAHQSPAAPVVPTATEVVKPSPFCLRHREHKLEFLCEECNVPICSYCILMTDGGHSGHQNAFVGDLEPKYTPKIKELLLEVKEVQSALEHTVKVLHGENKVTTEWEEVDKQISEHIAWQFAQVQLNGMRLRAALAAAKAASGTHGKLIDGVVENLDRIKGLVACGMSYRPSESLWLKQSLEEACAVPCRVYKKDQVASVLLSLDEEMFLNTLEISAVLEIPESSGVAVFPLKETAPDGWIPLERNADQVPLAERVCEPRDQPIAEARGAAVALLAALEPPLVPPMDPKGLQSQASSIRSSMSSIVSTEPSNTCHGFIAPGTSEFVKISHFVDPSDFYVVREEDSAFRDELIGKLKYAFRKLTRPEAVNYGEIVLAKYAGDGRWYRAQVMSTDPSKLRVVFIDYGNVGTVSLGCVRSLPSSFTIVPPLAVRCRLNNASPRGGTEWSNAAIRWFIKIADGNLMKCYVKCVEDNVAHVDLGQITDADARGPALSVADCAVFMHFAQYIVEPAVNDETMELPSGFVRRSKLTYPAPRRWHANQSFNAKVSHVQEADCFFVHVQDAVAGAKIVEINKQLTKLCQPLYDAGGDGDNIPVSVPKKDLVCAAHFSMDSMWYRALVTEVLEEKRVKVFFVDYGNSDVVSVDDIRHLPRRFTNDPPLAIECCLHGIKPPGGAETFSPQATDMVDDLTIDQVIKLTVRKVQDFPTRYEVLVINKRGFNVARVLTQSKLAERTSTPSVGESDSDDDSLPPSIPPTMLQQIERDLEPALAFLGESYPRENGLEPLEEKDFFSQAAKEDVIHTPIRPETVTDASLTEIVFVKCVSPDQIFISLKSAIYHFNDMKVSMELYYAKSEPTDCSWTPGERCAALRACDRSWHRGIVREVDQDAGVALVELRDIVCRERVPLSLLRPLDESFTRVRDSIFTVCIGGVTPAGGKSWTHQAAEFAVRWTGIHKPTHIIKRGEIIDGRLPVELLARESVLSGALEPAVERFVSLNKELLANGLALPVRGAQDWPIWSSVEVTKEVEENEEVSEWAYPNQGANDPPEVDLWPGVRVDQPLQPGSWLPIDNIDMVAFEAIPTNVDEQGFIYLHSIHDNSTLKSMTDQLQRQFNSAPPPPGEFALRPGMPCVTRYHCDNLWYRAETLKELPDGRWEVIFVDYGSRDTLPSSKIWPTTFLSEIPVVCRKVALANVRPILEDGRWSRVGLDALHSLIVEKQCTVLLRCPVGTPDPVTVLLVRHDGLPISAQMVEIGHARYAEVKPGMVPGRSPGGPDDTRPFDNSDYDSDNESDRYDECRSPPLQPQSRDEQSSPDFIECDDDEDDVDDEDFLVAAVVREISLEQDDTLEGIGELDDTVAADNLFETCDVVTFDDGSNPSDTEFILEDESVIFCEQSAHQEVSDEDKVLDSEDEIDSKENEVMISNAETAISDDSNKDVSGSDKTETFTDGEVTSPDISVIRVESDAKAKDKTGAAAQRAYWHYEFPNTDLAEVLVQAIESWEVIKVVPQDQTSLERLEKLSELTARMQTEVYQQPLLGERTFLSPCAAQFGDGQWRRAIIGEQKAQNIPLPWVCDVDYSCWERVSPNRLRECRSDWMTLPTLAISANLQGYKLAPGTSAKAGKAVLARYLKGETFTARVLSRTPNLVLELYVKGTTTSAIEPLIANGVLEAANMD